MNENTSAPHDPAHAKYVDPEGRCLWCGRLYLESEVTKLRAEVQHNYEMAQQEKKDREAALVEAGHLREMWESARTAVKNITEIVGEVTKDRDIALLQVDELRKEVARQHGDQFTCGHDAAFAGGACAACHAEVLDGLETIAKACEGATGAALMGIGSVARRALSHCTKKPKNEQCVPCARPDMACEEHGKPVGVSKVSGPGFCGECLAVMPCKVHTEKREGRS